MRFLYRPFLVTLIAAFPSVILAGPAEFFQKYCHECHGGATPEAALDLTRMPLNFATADLLRRGVKVHDRIAEGSMPPKSAPQPTAEERVAAVQELSESLTAAETTLLNGRTPLRRLTRAEYEHTIRDLFAMPGIALAGDLPADGSAHGFDRNADALDISHVNVAKYLEAADHVLNYAIATRPQPPVVQQRRISLANPGGFVAHVLMNGDGVLLKNGLPDPDFPPAAEQNHLDQGLHERIGAFGTGSSVGLFRHEDESFNPYFIEHVTIYPGAYRVRTSLWSFQWDQGKVLPGRRTESGRLSVVQLTGDGRGGQHPSNVLGYFDAPVNAPQEHELNVWLNHNELVGFNTASLAPAANYARKGRAMTFTGPGIVVDWLDIEGPLHDVWPPRSHTVLFGDLPLTEFIAADNPGVRPPARPKVRHLGAAKNRPDAEPGLWTVRSASPTDDARRLLRVFLPKLFRRPVAEDVVQRYVHLVEQRLATGDAFETAMRAAYKVALCSPDFLYHVEADGERNDFALANRLSYFLWNSLPDEPLRKHAVQGDLRKPEVLHAEVQRLLASPRSQRFIDDFVGQWLKVRQIGANDPDRKLYPEFSPFLQDTMVAETRAYFRELLERNLPAETLVRSDFLMLNEKLATHYGVNGVSGTALRSVPLPAGCPRGGFLTQAAILKVTANGTTTSPVPRGAFVMDRILGEPPEPPPSNVAAIEPDVRGATTIREQLAKHRDHAACASCHANIDPPGFALEAFDVIGGFRQRYRSIGDGDPAERGSIDPFIPISFRWGPAVDASGTLPDGHAFANITEYQHLLAADAPRLLRNLARQWMVYATGRELRFSDRAAIDTIVNRTLQAGGGLRTLLHEVIASPLFTGVTETVLPPADLNLAPSPIARGADAVPGRMMMATTLPAVEPIRVSAPMPPVTEPKPIQIREDRTITCRVRGLYAEDRLAHFRSLLTALPQVRLQQLDFETTEAVIAYDPECDLLRGANAQQVRERLSQQLETLSRHHYQLMPLETLSRAQQEQAEFTIVGLDCPSCSLAAYEILMRTEGVQTAWASFHDRRATAWIDPTRTSRDKLLAALKQQHVTLEEAP